MDDETPQPVASDTPLSEVPGFSAQAVAALEAQWVKTVGQFLAMAATPPGRKGLALLLATDAAGLQQLVDTANGVVGAREAERLADARPGGPIGLVLSKDAEPAPEPAEPASEETVDAPGEEPDAEQDVEADDELEEEPEDELEEELEEELESEAAGEAEGGER